MHLANGFMDDTEIQKAISEDEIVICPYYEKNLTPVGYNLSFSRFIISLRKKVFIKIKRDYNENERCYEWFFNLRPNETVLVLTRESIWVSRFIGGTFHSKVSLVTKGLGHVSTTLDPGWQGQLLVPINNPTKDKIKIVIAKEEIGAKPDERIYQTFITMILFRAEYAAVMSDDNPRPRIELIEEILKNKKKNKDTADLKEIIYKIKQSNGYPVVYKDLNDPTKREEKIIEFHNLHKKLLSDMDNTFDDINKVSTTSNNWRAFAFWSLVGGIILLLITLGALGYIIKCGKYKDYSNLLISILIPFIILGLNHIKDKFL